MGVLGTALAGARLLQPTSNPPVPVSSRTSTRPKRAQPQPALVSEPTPAPAVDRLLARLAAAATATERCALLERVQPSEDAQPTYAITALLERSQLASVRACATQALARQPSSEAQSFLVDLAEDPEPEVHRSALEALATRDAAARAVVVEATHSEDLELRVSAVEALLKAKRAEAYAAAVRVLPQVEDPETLSSLIDALGQSQDRQALPALEALLDDAERESHLHAISALGELGVPSAAVRLESLLEVGSSEEFSAAAEALKQLMPERALPKLRAVLASENSERQQLALSALLSLEPPDLSSIMREALKSADRRRVLLVLSRLNTAPDPSFEAELIAVVEQGERRLVVPAMRALSRLSTPSAQAALQRLAQARPNLPQFQELSSDDPERRGDPAATRTLRADLRGDRETRNAALTALVQLGDDSVGPELERLARSDVAADRELAVQLFSTRPDPVALRELEQLAADPDPQVMSPALQALQARSPELVSRLALRALRESAPEDRVSLLSSFGALTARLSRPLFEFALNDTDDSVAVQAIQSLANLQGAASAQRLLSLVTDSSRSEQVRAEAASGLRTLGGPLARANRALLDSLSEPEAPGEFTCNPN